MTPLEIAALSAIVVGGCVLFGCVFAFTLSMIEKARAAESAEDSSTTKGMEF